MKEFWSFYIGNEIVSGNALLVSKIKGRGVSDNVYGYDVCSAENIFRGYFFTTIGDIVNNFSSRGVALSADDIAHLKDFEKTSLDDIWFNSNTIFTSGRFIDISFEPYSVTKFGKTAIFVVRVFENAKCISVFQFQSWQYKKLLEKINAGKDVHRSVVGISVKQKENLLEFGDGQTYGGKITVDELGKIVTKITEIEERMKRPRQKRY